MRSCMLVSLVYFTSIALRIGICAQYVVRPLKLGVEVTGFNLQEHLNDTALFDQIKCDTHKYRLMVFRDQGEIPADALFKIFKGFGEISMGPFTFQKKGMLKHPKSPDLAVMRISNDADEGHKGTGTGGWHIDGAYKQIPYLFLVFNSVKAPMMGDTKFVGQRDVLAAMPKEQVKYLDHLWAVNGRTLIDDKTAVIHPLLYNHPVVNDSVMIFHLGYLLGAIYENGNATTHRVLSNMELLKLKSALTHAIQVDNERLVYSHKWRDGDLVIIDNQQLFHVPTKQSQMPREKVGLRILHRLAITGFQTPTKKRRYFEN